MATDALLAPPPALPPQPSLPGGRRRLLVDVSVLALLAWWATFLTWGTGGREPHLLSTGLVLLAVALVAAQPWRTAPVWVLVPACAVSVAAACVPVVAPTGWDGASEAASWVFAACTTLLVSAWARERRRRQLVIVCLAASPLFSFAHGFVAWWGNGDPSRPFVGTFYWHNQAAAFMVLGVVAGMGLALHADRVLRFVGWLAVALCGAGVVVSTSRASMAVLGLVLIALLVVGIATRSVGVAVRTSMAAGLIVVTAWALTGPPFFGSRATVLSGTAERTASGESLAANGGHRLDDWAWSVKVLRHWPLTGTGFHGFGAGSRAIDPAGRGSLTPFAHNGFLQVLVDGGLLLGVPVLTALLVLAWCSTRRAARALRARDWSTLCLAAALAALGAHSAVDFDWSYPSLLSAFGLVSGLMAADGPQGRSCRSRTAAGACLVLLVLGSVIPAWPGGLDLSAPLGSHA